MKSDFVELPRGPGTGRSGSNGFCWRAGGGRGLLKMRLKTFRPVKCFCFTAVSRRKPFPPCSSAGGIRGTQCGSSSPGAASDVFLTGP